MIWVLVLPTAINRELVLGIWLQFFLLYSPECVKSAIVVTIIRFWCRKKLLHCGARLHYQNMAGICPLLMSSSHLLFLARTAEL